MLAKQEQNGTNTFHLFGVLYADNKALSLNQDQTRQKDLNHFIITSPNLAQKCTQEMRKKTQILIAYFPHRVSLKTKREKTRQPTLWKIFITVKPKQENEKQTGKREDDEYDNLEEKELYT